MRPFEEFWTDALKLLDGGVEVRNWTGLNGYSVGGTFIARSYRSFTKEQQALFNNGHPFEDANDWIICTQIQGPGIARVSKKEFRDRYYHWRSYRSNGITRKAFGGETNASPYLIALFHALDSLTGA
jgi:hypothetical protein